MIGLDVLDGVRRGVLPTRATSLVMAAALLICGCPQSHTIARWDCTGNPCDDGDACNGAEACDPERGCLAGRFVDCDDGDPCSVDACVAGACTHAPRDLDSDGYADPCAGGDDCAPEDAAVHPGADEVCNGRDDDCDLEVDEGLELGPRESLATNLVTSDGHQWRPEAVLDDGTIVFLYGTEVAALHAGVEQRGDLGEAPAPWFNRTRDLGPGQIVTSDGLWSVTAGGPGLLAVNGQQGHSFDSLDVSFVAWNGSLDASLVRRIEPADGDKASPASVDPALLGASPVVAWAEARRGRCRVLTLPLDGAEIARRREGATGRLPGWATRS